MSLFGLFAQRLPLRGTASVSRLGRVLVRDCGAVLVLELSSFAEVRVLRRELVLRLWTDFSRLVEELMGLILVSKIDFPYFVLLLLFSQLALQLFYLRCLQLYQLLLVLSYRFGMFELGLRSLQQLQRPLVLPLIFFFPVLLFNHLGAHQVRIFCPLLLAQLRLCVLLYVYAFLHLVRLSLVRFF